MQQRDIKINADAAFHRIGTMIDSGALDQVKILMSDRFAAILQKYIDVSPRYLSAIETAWRQRDAVLITENAHALRSCSLSMGARGVAVLADNIEMMAETNPTDFTVFGAMIDSLKVAHNITLHEMRDMLQKLDKSDT